MISTATLEAAAELLIAEANRCDNAARVAFEVEGETGPNATFIQAKRARALRCRAQGNEIALHLAAAEHLAAETARNLSQPHAPSDESRFN